MDKIKHLTLFTFIFIFCLSFSSMANDKCIVTVSKLNVRDSTSTDSKILGKLNINDTLDIIDIDNQWVKIKYGENYGYVAEEFVTLLKTQNETPIYDSENEENKYLIYLIIAGGVIILGAILGYTKTIMVYRDFADLTIVFLSILFPMLILNYAYSQIEDEELLTLVEYGAYSLLGLMIVFIAVSTHKDNKNIIWTSIALLVKIPLAIIFLSYLMKFFSSDKNKSKKEQVKDKIGTGLFLLLILGLVRHKVWRYRPSQTNYKGNLYNKLDDRVGGLKKELKELEELERLERLEGFDEFNENQE